MNRPVRSVHDDGKARRAAGAAGVTGGKRRLRCRRGIVIVAVVRFI
jgi:hypothetical protein